MCRLKIRSPLLNFNHLYVKITHADPQHRMQVLVLRPLDYEPQFADIAGHYSHRAPLIGMLKEAPCRIIQDGMIATHRA